MTYSRANQNPVQGKTIRSQILNGYLTVIIIIAVLIIGSLVCLLVVERGYKDVAAYQTQQCAAQEIVTSHYKWLNSLNASILDGVEFTGSLDPETCSLGKWLTIGDYATVNDPEMSNAIASIIVPHKELHAAAAGLVELSKTDRNAAYLGFANEIRPRVEMIGSGLGTAGTRYAAISEKKITDMSRVVILSFAMCIALGVLAIVTALIYARKISIKISRPLAKVAEWSEALVTGVENILLEDAGQINTDHIIEIDRMMYAFQKMVQGIQDDVSVIRRIAEGDMTVYVEIKSAGDPLGKNLYRLVQNNDMLFSNLLQIADSVAVTSGSIATASQTQAQQAVEQAGAVENLSITVAKANELAEGNAQRARLAATVSEEIKGEIHDGSEKMSRLLKAVDDISSASQQISSVMKAIDDIAFQTNILALNAAVEAARAGSAGKGFAVVADEVRNLALKSAEAAKRSTILIENTINKTSEGNRISQETYEMFDHIVGSTNKIANVIEEISAASEIQQTHMDSIHGEIQKITQAVSSNAASSEETAAATQEMNRNSALIRQEMNRFNLRKRVQGQAYIPPEKANDPDFIRSAQANYQKSLNASTSAPKLQEPDKSTSFY